MSLRYLLDTNVLSEPLRPKPNTSVMEMLRLHDGEVATATIVWHELIFGCQRLPESKKRRSIETYLKEVVQPNIPILPYNKEAATWHAQERTRLVSLGKTPPFVDSQIAAIASVNEFVLITRNLSDYSDFRDLELENWYK
ncbi:PilT protein domain protein (plasmid) [Stanieria cyanosphaera PCC 7437]|uniref:PilT protein domain protein n=1 Tax=Stanieria cyanosphaera (strain ATCC 29371 / PCC 7437) TaxID=111780 RepID=K9Y1L5_STAC7|nr:type II toxin-antitoxin system VapC family toxin [Stanieria cyanosphaera]AFZ38301.1 PilT protein domain protein [Stanieria cyanosphaera PCC 7437]